MLNISANPASTNTVLTHQHLQREVRAYECMDESMDRLGDPLLILCAGCIDAPSMLPTGAAVSSVTLNRREWFNRAALDR